MEPILIPWMLATSAATTRKRCYGSSSPEDNGSVGENDDLLDVLIPTKRLTKLQTQNAIPQFRLTFYNARGMAEMSRMILAYAGIPFEDVRLKQEDTWNKVKKESPHLTLPILEWNGKKLCGGDAIARMLAKMYGLAGQDVFEQAQADAILGVMRDFMNTVLNYIKFKCCFELKKDTDDLEKLYVEIFLPNVKRYFNVLEQYASAQTRDGFFLHSGISYVDFAIANLYDSLYNLHPDLMIEFRNVRSIVQRVFALSQLQTYLSRRPKTVW